MAKISFCEIAGDGDKTIYEMDVMADRRVEAVLAWQRALAEQGVDYEDYQVLGIKGLDNPLEKKLADEERKRGRSW